jgi:hypothetical protein
MDHQHDGAAVPVSRVVAALCGVALAAGVATGVAQAEAPGAKPFGKPRITRAAKLITDLDLTKLAPQPIAVGSGLFAGRRVDDLGCSDSSDGKLAEVGAAFTDEAARVRVEVVAVTPAGKSGRGWAGARCRYRLSDTRDQSRTIELGDALVPPFGFVSGVVRDGDVAYVQLGWNGYAREANGKGNFVAAVDLAAGRLLWRTADMTSNAAMVVAGDYLVTGYGFTKEKAALHAFDRKTGALVQSLPLPKAPADILLTSDGLVVRLYDGYAKIPLAGQK